MSTETPKKPYPSLAEFDEIWRKDSERSFYAIVCEALGTDEEAYKKLTMEIIAEYIKNNPENNPDAEAKEAITGILRCLNKILTRKEFRGDEARMRVAHEGMNVWYNLLKPIQISANSRKEIEDVLRTPEDTEPVEIHPEDDKHLQTIFDRIYTEKLITIDSILAVVSEYEFSSKKTGEYIKARMKDLFKMGALDTSKPRPKVVEMFAVDTDVKKV